MPTEKTTEPQPLTLATKVTIIRLLGVPVFILLLLYYGRSLAAHEPEHWLRWAALGLFVTIAATDALDGYLARSRNEITWLGRVLDPLADKALTLAGILLLSRPSLPELQPQFPVWFIWLVISRDAITIGGVFLIDFLTGTVTVRPRTSGKAATFFVMIAIGLALADISDKLFHGFVWLAASLILLSFILYLRDGWRQLDREQPKPTDPES